MFDPSKYWTGRFHKMTIRCSLIVVTSLFVSLSVSHPALASPEVKQMQVNGTTLSYVEEGTGEPVVFVHGAISDMRAWDDYRARIAGKRRFIAYTQRYFGSGEWPDKAEHFSRETHAEDLIGLIKALNAGPVHLVTWSYSGGIGTYAVLKRPDLFRSIVHFEPAADALVAGVPGSIVARKEMLKAFGPAMKAVKAGQLEDAALRFVEAVFRMPEGAAVNEPEPWPTYWRENGRTIPPFIAAHPGAAISCEHLRAIDVPTLVVQGENTHTRYSMMAENLSRCQANALLVTMPAVTHDGPYRKPDEFAALIENFLALVD
jgi:pimeloyl-ACP methyl ester carboxylesterase